MQQGTLLLGFESSWPGFPISEIALICLSGISSLDVIMVFLKGYVFPLGKIRNLYFFCL